MGTAEKLPEPPKEKIVFAEDLAKEKGNEGDVMVSTCICFQQNPSFLSLSTAIRGYVVLCVARTKY